MAKKRPKFTDGQLAVAAILDALPPDDLEDALLILTKAYAHVLIGGLAAGGDVTEDRERIEDGSVWMTQAEIAALFETTPQNITQHIKTVYGDAELDEAATCKKLLQVRSEGGREVKRQAKIFKWMAVWTPIASMFVPVY